MSELHGVLLVAVSYCTCLRSEKTADNVVWFISMTHNRAYSAILHGLWSHLSLTPLAGRYGF